MERLCEGILRLRWESASWISWAGIQLLREPNQLRSRDLRYYDLAEDDSRALSNAAEVCCHSPLLESASMMSEERPWRQVPGPDFVPGDSWLPECRNSKISDLAAKTVRESDWARCCSSAGAWRVWCQCCSGWESMWGSLRLETAQISFARNF